MHFKTRSSEESLFLIHSREMNNLPTLAVCQQNTKEEDTFVILTEI